MVRKSSTNAASDARPYTGKIRINDPASDLFTIKSNFTYEQSLTTSAGGDVAFRLRTSDVTNSEGWDDMSASYQEFRVLGFQVMWVPKYNQTYNASVIPGAGAHATTHVTGVATPDDIGDVVKYDTFRVCYSGRPFTATWRARGFEELQWVSTSVANDSGGIIGYLNGMTASTLYGRLITVYLVEFRGRN